MSFRDLMELLTFLSPAALLMGIGTGAYFYHVLQPVYKIITLYFILAFTADIGSRIYGLVYNNNLVFILLFSLVELALFSWLYLACFFRGKKPVLLAMLTAGGIFIAWEIVSLRFSQVHTFQSYAKVTDTFLIVLLSVLFFIEKIKSNTHLHSPLFRLNAAILAFFSLNLIFFLPLNFMINEGSGLKFYLWLINLIITVLFYICLTREIWKNGSNPKQLQFGLSS